MLLLHITEEQRNCIYLFEDFYLSATTLLQIIAATEKGINHRPNAKFLPSIQSASSRAGINPLSDDFKDMRNNLIHEGRLLGGRFSGTTIQDCSAVAADVMNWFDDYIHSVLHLGTVKRKRYNATDFINLNAYSL